MQQPQANNNSSNYLDVGNIVKSGYLKKLKTMRKKFFVIWGATETTSAVLEYYDNEKKFRLGLGAKRAIHLSTCFNINTNVSKSDSKNKYVISLYTRDDSFAIVMEDEEQQNEWMKVLLEQQRASGDGRPIPLIEHIWQVTVKSKGLGSSQNLSGNYRLCLMAGTINLVKMNAENGDLQFPLSVVRRCGHSDCFFFMEVGRQAITGSGEMWMQVEDSVIAHNIHEATLNAMRSSGQSEDMRPRSHSGSSSSITGGDVAKSNAAPVARRNTTASSWRQRCDSLPVHNRGAAARSLRHRGSSEGEDGFREDDYAIPPSGGSSIRPRTSSEGAAPFAGLRFPRSLIKSSKPRPRTSSEGESHFRGSLGHESPSKNRGRHSMPAMRSASVSSGYRPMSVHRIGSQPISNSPPIPNSPLSESPGNFPDEQFIPGTGVGHSPTDVYGKEDHFFGTGYNNGQMNSLKRSKGRTAEPQCPIREESMESADEYMNMAVPPKTSGDELDPYMDMSSANHTPRSSFSGSIGGTSSPPKSPTSRGSAKKSYDPVTPTSTAEGYMMMVPSSAKQRTPTQPEPVPTTPSSDSTPYMYMSPPLPPGLQTGKKMTPLVLPELVLPSTPGNPTPEVASSTGASDCPPGSGEGLKKVGKPKEPAKERLFDSYANVEFSPVTTHKTISPQGGEEGGQDETGVQATEGDFVKSDYMNMKYNPKKRISGFVSSPRNLSNGVEGKGAPECSESGKSTNSHNEQIEADYAKMEFSGKDRSVSDKNSAREKTSMGKENLEGNVKGAPSKEKLFEGDFMNVDLSMGSTRLSFPNSPVTRGSKVNSGTTVSSHSLQQSLEELQLREGTRGNRLGRPLSLSAGTVHPKGSLTPNLTLHHSPVNSANATSQKHELNYIDVEADRSNPPRKSDSSSPLSPSSPFRTQSSEEKDSGPVTYATIDFTKSEGLRNVSAMRESRF